MEPSNRVQRIRLPILLLAAGVVALGPTFASADGIDGFSPPPRETAVCLDCHDDYDVGLAMSPHRVATELAEGMEARVTCTDCHVGDPRHYEDDPEDYPMPLPGAQGASTLAGICSSCHQNSHQQNMLEKNIHLANDVGCSDCHRIHGSHESGLLQAPEPDLCYSCHVGVKGQFAQPFRHPVSDGIVKCSECHLSLDETAGDLSWNGTNSVCVKCHLEFEGPFPFEHQATMDYSPEEGGCLACHEAHGSSQPRMLRQPYEAPHFQLCTQCHQVPPLHQQNPQHGAEWAGIACNECHTDVHGSYTSRSFLSPVLETQGCLKAGCHK